MRRLRFLVDPAELDRALAGGAHDRERPSGEREAEGNGRVRLPDEEGRHLRVSLRGRAGDEVHVFDGRGRGFAARVASVAPEGVEVVLLEEDLAPVEAPLRLVLLQALSRDDAFERAVDEATALGVTAIVPLVTERTKPGPRAAAGRRLERWRRIAREASKLSWRRVVPEVEEPVRIEDLPGLGAGGAVGLLLDPGAAPGTLGACLDRPRPVEARIAVGPEGGFSGGERERLVQAGFHPVGLGPRVLRTEHAGPAALAVLLSRWGDLG